VVKKALKIEVMLGLILRIVRHCVPFDPYGGD